MCVCVQVNTENIERRPIKIWTEQHNVAEIVDGMKTDVHNFNIL